MPRPRHPIREHFTEIPESTRRNGAISCNYCGREQSAGNPKRCQKHLDECPQYAQVLAALDAGHSTSFSVHSLFDSPVNAAQNPNRILQYGAASNTSGFVTPGRGPVESSQSPSASYQRMSEDQIMHTLGIDQDEYREIECELDGQMMMLNISGAGLLTQGGRNLLKQAFFQLNDRWSILMKHPNMHEKNMALTSMAYIANRKRRIGQPPNTSVQRPGMHRKNLHQWIQESGEGEMATTQTPAAQVSPVQPPPVKVVKQPPQPLGLTTIIAERAEPGGAFVICRPEDLIEQPKAPEDITVTDLKFMPFISLLQHDDDVMFNAANDDKIVHTFVGGRTKTVSNEVVWRVALREMHHNGANPFVFKIYKRHGGIGIEQPHAHPNGR